MSKIRKYNKFNEEAELNLKELGKTRDGEFRGNILVQKLKTHQPITTNNNKDIKVDKMKDDGAWVDIFINRKVPFSKEMLGDTPIQTIQVGAPKPKNSSGAMEMQTKVAILMMQMNERP
jgi:hypothetical protein